MAARDLFACSTPLYAGEDLSFLEDNNKCANNSFKTSWMRNVALGKLTVAILPGYCAFGATTLESLIPALTCQVFISNLGVFLCLYRADMSMGVLLAWVVLAFGQDSYVWTSSKAKLASLNAKSD